VEPTMMLALLMIFLSILAAVFAVAAASVYVSYRDRGLFIPDSCAGCATHDLRCPCIHCEYGCPARRDLL
jgi:hypothetical protein